jgi:putative FmdB family regulatory protein
MPTYEYRCRKGHEFELFQRMSDDPVSECPECGEMSERILSGGAGFIFKGDGFYITDYRSDDYKKAASSDKENATPSDKSSDGAKGKDSKSGSSSSSSSSSSESSSSGSSSSSKDSRTKSSSSD